MKPWEDCNIYVSFQELRATQGNPKQPEGNLRATWRPEKDPYRPEEDLNQELLFYWSFEHVQKTLATSTVFSSLWRPLKKIERPRKDLRQT